MTALCLCLKYSPYSNRNRVRVEYPMRPYSTGSGWEVIFRVKPIVPPPLETFYATSICISKTKSPVSKLPQNSLCPPPSPPSAWLKLFLPPTHPICSRGKTFLSSPLPFCSPPSYPQLVTTPLSIKV